MDNTKDLSVAFWDYIKGQNTKISKRVYNMIFIKKLQKEKGLFVVLELEQYKKKAMLEVLEYLKQFEKENKRENKTIYNRELEDYIKGKHKIPKELERYLETEVYLAQHDYRDEKQVMYNDKMLARGWLKLTKDVEYRGKIELSAIASLDWLTSDISQEGKLITSGNGEVFFIPKGKRSRGYYVYSLKNAFYKIIK